MSLGIPAAVGRGNPHRDITTVEVVVSKENVFIVCYEYLLNLNMLLRSVLTGMSDRHGITPNLHKGTPINRGFGQ
jgi:hypothetical protein